MGLRAQEIGVEMANALSQIKLNESQANKNEAEANKIKGVDTEAQQATIDNLIAKTSNEKIKRGLILGQIRVADAEEELKKILQIGQRKKPRKHDGMLKASKKELTN